MASQQLTAGMHAVFPGIVALLTPSFPNIRMRRSRRPNRIAIVAHPGTLNHGGHNVILRSDAPERPVDSVPGYCCICHARDGAAIWAEAGYLGRVCDCGLVHIDPFPLFGPQDRTDFHAAEYYAIAARLRLRWLSHYAPTGRLLEIGCGRGDFLHAAHEAGYSVAAVEPNAAHLRELRTWDALERTPAFFTRLTYRRRGLTSCSMST